MIAIWQRFMFVFILVTGSWFIWWCLTGPVFNVLTIYIEGNRDLFLQTGFYQKKRNLLWIDEKQFTKEITGVYPAVKKIRIEKKFPHELYIKIYEREPLFSFFQGNQKMYSDEEGILLPVFSRYPPEKLVQLTCAIKSSSNNQIEDTNLVRIFLLLSKLKKKLELPLYELICEEKLYRVRIGATDVLLAREFKAEGELVDSLQFLFKQFRIEGNYPKVVDFRFAKPVLVPFGVEVGQSASSSTQAAEPKE